MFTPDRPVERVERLIKWPPVPYAKCILIRSPLAIIAMNKFSAFMRMHVNLNKIMMVDLSTTFWLDRLESSDLMHFILADNF